MWAVWEEHAIPFNDIISAVGLLVLIPRISRGTRLARVLEENILSNQIVLTKYKLHEEGRKKKALLGYNV